MNKTIVMLAVARLLVVLSLTAGTSFADIIVGTATRSWGTAKVERDGSDIPFTPGMDLKDGDKIKTERNSGAEYELFDRNGVPIVKEEIYGLPGTKGCADAEGERGKGLVEIRRENISPGIARIISEVIKGTAKTKTKPGKEAESKYHEMIARQGVIKKLGTELALSYDLGSDQTSLSTLSGLVGFDNIEYDTLPDAYFTDPFNKCYETLNLDFVLTLTTPTVGLFNLLGAGNAVNVSADYYSIVASPPSAPVLGLAPIHKLPGGLSPEPATMALLALGGVALLRRKK